MRDEKLLKLEVSLSLDVEEIGREKMKIFRFFFLSLLTFVNSETRREILCKVKTFSSDSCAVEDETIDDARTVIKTESSMNIKNIFIALGDVKFLPIEIFEFFPLLESFSSSNGNFEEVSKENFEKLTKLEILSLTVGKFKKIEKNSFEDLKALKVLNLADNKISYINSKTFMNLRNLTTLDLKGNELKTLHPKSFENLENLMILRLNENNLITLDRELFVDKPKLQEIHAMNNNFKHIDEFTFDGLSSLNFLGIFSENCKVGKFNGKIDLSEVKEDLRDKCKGSDFEIYEIHAKVNEIIRENEISN